MCRGAAAAWILATSLPVAGAERLAAGPAGAPSTVAAAVQRAQDGDTIELLPGEYSETVLIEKRKLTLRGVGKVVIKGDGKPGATPALWTVRGGEVTIENIEFRGARASDGGGAGLRQEGGRLTVRVCNFFDNEYGLLALNDDSATLTIERSVFGLAPKVVGGLYHLLNVGRIGRLDVTGSRFQQGFEGHLIKSRARESFIAYNYIHDGVRGGASYEIDLANGGVATVLGNVIAQGSDRQNMVLLAYGTDGRAWDKNALLVSHNTFINYGWTPGWFMRVFRDRLPENTEVWAINNLLVGTGIFWLGASGNFDGNRHATEGMLRDVETGAFELSPGSMWRGAGVDPRRIGGRDLSPKAEFEWPLGTRELKGERNQWSPGAFQR